MTAQCRDRVLSVDTWHHVAVRARRPRRIEPVGRRRDGSGGRRRRGRSRESDARAWTDGPRGTGERRNVNLALDEWGIWSSAIDVAALYARRDAYRQFGGYIFGIVDRTDIGPDDRHVLDLSVTGYGLRLDANYVREVYASRDRRHGAGDRTGRARARRTGGRLQQQRRRAERRRYQGGLPGRVGDEHPP